MTCKRLLLPSSLVSTGLVLEVMGSIPSGPLTKVLRISGEIMLAVMEKLQHQRVIFRCIIKLKLKLKLKLCS